MQFTNSRGVDYYLHTKEVRLRSAIRRRIYYFRKSIDDQFACWQLPSGYRVLECRTGLPVLKKA